MTNNLEIILIYRLLECLPSLSSCSCFLLLGCNSLARIPYSSTCFLFFFNNSWPLKLLLNVNPKSRHRSYSCFLLLECIWLVLFLILFLFFSFSTIPNYCKSSLIRKATCLAHASSPFGKQPGDV